jgi:hypothetical protein
MMINVPTMSKIIYVSWSSNAQEHNYPQSQTFILSVHNRRAFEIVKLNARRQHVVETFNFFLCIFFFVAR